MLEDLRNQVELVSQELADLRARYRRGEPLDNELMECRQRASDALRALFEAAPEERPPSQSIGT